MVERRRGLARAHAILDVHHASFPLLVRVHFARDLRRTLACTPTGREAVSFERWTVGVGRLARGGRRERGCQAVSVSTSEGGFGLGQAGRQSARHNLRMDVGAVEVLRFTVEGLDFGGVGLRV